MCVPVVHSVIKGSRHRWMLSSDKDKNSLTAQFTSPQLRGFGTSQIDRSSRLLSVLTSPSYQLNPLEMQQPMELFTVLFRQITQIYSHTHVHTHARTWIMQCDRVSANKQSEAECSISPLSIGVKCETERHNIHIRLTLYSPRLMKHSSSLNIAYVVQFCWYISLLWIINPCCYDLLKRYPPIRLNVVAEMLIWICSPNT